MMFCTYLHSPDCARPFGTTELETQQERLQIQLVSPGSCLSTEVTHINDHYGKKNGMPALSLQEALTIAIAVKGNRNIRVQSDLSF